MAEAAGRSYVCSCCVAPLLSNLLQSQQDWIEGCAWTQDRVELAERYGVADDLMEKGAFVTTAYLLFSCGCSTCLLIQELNHIKAVRMGLAPGPGGSGSLGVANVVPQQRVMLSPDAIGTGTNPLKGGSGGGRGGGVLTGADTPKVITNW